MNINYNISANRISRMLSKYRNNVNKVTERLSSGRRINNASDDPIGMSVSSHLNVQAQGLKTAVRNIQDATSLLQVADGYLSGINENLMRIRNLAIQSANGVYSEKDRKMVELEVKQLASQVDDISKTASFNNIRLLRGGLRNPLERQSNISNGSNNQVNTNNMNNNSEATNDDLINKDKGGLLIHSGAYSDQNNRVFIANMSSDALGLTSNKGENLKVNLSTSEEANNSIKIIDQAIDKVNIQRSNNGAYQNGLDIKSKSLEIAAENIMSAKSNISDADISKESINYIQQSLKLQTSTQLLTSNLNNASIVKYLFNNLN